MSDNRDRATEAAWYLDAGRPLEALEVLRDADADDVRAALIRARALLGCGRTAHAEEEARRALSLAPENPLALEMLATVQLATNPAAADGTIRRALATDPENPSLLRLKVIILLELARYEGAERALERLMRVAPDDDETQHVRTMFMMRAVAHEAPAAAREFLGRHPDDAYAHYLRGFALLQGFWWRAFRHFDQAVALRPQDPLLAETARVMKKWFMWPAHILSGVTWWGLFIPVWYVFFVMGDGAEQWRLLGLLFGLLAYRWLTYLVARVALNRRVARALRDSYG